MIYESNKSKKEYNYYYVAINKQISTNSISDIPYQNIFIPSKLE